MSNELAVNSSREVRHNQSFTQRAIGAIKYPEACEFPWNEIESTKLSKIKSRLAVCEHYYDWIDHLEIALFKEEISLREALLLSACPTQHLSRLIPTNIYLSCDDYDEFKLDPDIMKGSEDPRVSSSRHTGCSFHLSSPLRDWWICPLENALFPGADRRGWVYGYAQTMLTLRTQVPLTQTKLDELMKMIARKDISVYSVLMTLATRTRKGPIDHSIEAGYTALLKSDIPLDNLVKYVPTLCSFHWSVADCPEKSLVNERSLILRSLWEALLCTDSRNEPEATCAQVLLSVFHTQLRMMRRLVHEFKLMIELFWQQTGSVKPSEASDIPAFQIFTPKFLHWTLARERWEAHNFRGFAPTSNEVERLLRDAINGLLNASDPSSLIALVKDDVVTFDTAQWLMIILSCEGKDAVLDVIRTCSVVPEVVIINQASQRWKFCLLQSISYLRVDERQSLNMICRDVRSFIHTPLMEENAMIETLNMTPFGIYHLLCARFSEDYYKYRNFTVEVVEKMEAIVASKKHKLRSWHQMGLYTYNMLAPGQRKFGAKDQRLWFPIGSTVLITWKGQEQPSRRLSEAYVVKRLEKTLSDRYSYVGRDDCFGLGPFNIKIYLSNPDIRSRALNISDQEVTPLHVLTPFGQPHCEWHLTADEIEAMKACAVTQNAEKLLSIHMEVFDLEPSQWWFENLRPPSANNIVGDHNQIREKMQSINDLQHQRLETWYHSEGTSLCADSIKVYSDDGWTFQGYKGSICTLIDVYPMRCVGGSYIEDYLGRVRPL